jgi:hypothetical protein
MIHPVIDISGLSGKEYSKLLEGLVSINQEILSNNPDMPPLYDSNINYQEEKAGEEVWKPLTRVIDAGVGDCEDLTAWRVAELRNQGEDVQGVFVDNGRGYHAVVEYSNGEIEDPSQILLESVGKKNRKKKRSRTMRQVGFLGELIKALTDKEVQGGIKDLVTYGRGKRRQRPREKNSEKDLDLEQLVKIIKLLQEKEVSGMNALQVGQRRRSQRKRGLNKRGSQARRLQRTRRKTKAQKITQLKNNLRKNLNHARKGINKHKRKVNELESKLSAAERTTQREINEITRDYQAWLRELQALFAEYVQYYQHGYDTTPEMQDLQNYYFEALDEYELAVSAKEDALALERDEIAYMIEHHENMIKESEEFQERKKEEIEEQIEELS